MLGRRVLKGDEVALLKSEVVPKNCGAAVEVKKVEGCGSRGGVDFVAFNPKSSAFLTIGVRT